LLLVCKEKNTMKKRAITLGLALVILSGCGPSLDITTIDHKPDGVHLTLSNTTGVVPNDVFRIVAPIQSTENYSHGRLRKVLGRVKVVKVLDNHEVLVEVTEGIVSGGVSAEKIE
jgi:hypothetical protein